MQEYQSNLWQDACGLCGESGATFESRVLPGKLFHTKCFHQTFFECEICSGFYNTEYQVNGQNLDLCENCSELIDDDEIVDYVKCYDCDSYLEEDKAKRQGEEYYCQECHEEAFSFCEQCEEYKPMDEVFYIDSVEQSVCQTCLDQNFTTCSDCNEDVPNDNSRRIANGDDICDECATNYFECENCNEVYHDELLGGEYQGALYCDSCYSDCDTEEDEEEEASTEVPTPRRMDKCIQRYSYKPEAVFSGTESSTFYGIELEVGGKATKEHLEYDATEVCNRNNNIYVKEDSSIKDHGFEVVSHPATYDYWKSEGKESMNSVLRYLNNEGYEAENAGGIHIHISLESFTSLHLLKFQKLIYDNQDFWKAVSRRKEDDLTEWAGFNGEEKLVAQAKQRISLTDRRSALNITEQTIEIRLWNSTIDKKEFWGTLELTKAAFEYSKNHGIGDMTLVGFVKYLEANNKSYQNALHTMCITQARIAA